MKPRSLKISLLLTLALANGFFAAAQTNHVPDATAYADFSRFITERNIFDPNRQPHSPGSRTVTYRPHPSRSAPTFTLVGTMSYQKGLFAFFDGNSSDLRQALSESGSIAGFTVSEITTTGVKLASADKKQTFALKIGDRMQQDGQDWVPTGPDQSPADTAEGNQPSANNAGAAAGAAPSAVTAPNDILKKLMQQREQELK